MHVNIEDGSRLITSKEKQQKQQVAFGTYTANIYVITSRSNAI